MPPLTDANAPAGIAPAIIAVMTTIPVELDAVRTVPKIPDAIPRLSPETALIMEFVLGGENSPCPNPIIAIGIQMLLGGEAVVRNDNPKRPRALKAIPTEVRILVSTRSESEPEITDVNACTTGCATRNSAAPIGEYPCTQLQIQRDDQKRSLVCGVVENRCEISCGELTIVGK